MLCCQPSYGFLKRIQNIDILASNIRHRHNILERSIGVFPKEQISFDRVTLLMWLVPLVVVTALLLDIILIAGIINISIFASRSFTGHYNPSDKFKSTPISQS
jgi:hypothetical protein